MTIPAVKEQVQRWTTARQSKAVEGPQHEQFAYGDLKPLGRIGRSTFACTPDGRELRIRGGSVESLDEAPSDAVVIRQPRRLSDGRIIGETFIGRVVEPGTFERLRRQKTYRPKPPRIGPLDGLAEHRKPADRVTVPLADDDDSPQGIIRGALSKRPQLLFTDGAAVPLTVRRLVEVVNESGGNLRHHNGHTLADWTQIKRWRSLLIAAWPLVEAYMAGAPLPCAYEHKDAPVADTLDPGGTPVCNPHCGIGDLAP
jgi:hypothetical protein